MPNPQPPSGKKVALKIFGCAIDAEGVVVVDKTPAFTAQINPSGYDHSYQIHYSQNKAIGTAKGPVRFDSVQPEKIAFKALVLDGTGAVAGVRMPVNDQVAALKNAIYRYVGQKHETPVVKVVWGTLSFFGRAEALKFDYTLFKPSGEPLRAKVSLSFLGFTSAAEEVKLKQNRSPDLTHLVVVKAGDTLPLLCERIYRDPAYHLEVARINGLTLLRQLEPGMSLRFPPLA
jgi:nucleoid-associated protein YgaU